MEKAFDWIKENGIPSESAYPYKGRDNACQSFEKAFEISGYSAVPANDPEQMQAALNKQPISIGIHASLAL